MRPDETLHRLSIAIEAMKQCREQLGQAHRGGEHHARALIAVITAEAQVDLVLRAMVEEEVAA